MTKEKRDATPVPVIRRRCCDTMSNHYRLLERTPGYRQVLSGLEASARSGSRTAALIGPNNIVTINVVVHVIYNTDAQRISDAQIKSQIDVLNADFSAANPDRSQIPSHWANLHEDTGIRFQLASKNPNGKKSAGIVRRKTSKQSFNSAQETMKARNLGGSNPWPTDRYLNIWICELSEGLLGYAQFPGGPPNTDGVVILNTAFGTTGSAAAPFNKGRTATHEIGHWLNLRHIWGDTEDCSGSDFVDDTPVQQHPNRNVPTYPVLSCNNAPHGDMFMNFMDYVDDLAMCMFTKGQVARMHATLRTARSGFMM
jgi:hypothetical protein